MTTAAPVTLHTLLGNHANTKAMKSSQVSSPLVHFDYFEVKVANTQFKSLVRDLALLRSTAPATRAPQPGRAGSSAPPSVLTRLSRSGRRAG